MLLRYCIRRVAAEQKAPEPEAWPPRSECGACWPDGEAGTPPSQHWEREHS